MQSNLSKMLRAHTDVLSGAGIPRVRAHPSLADTLKKRMRRTSHQSQLDLEDVSQVRGYISQVEAVLDQMKEWVSKKERSISSKASEISKPDIKSRCRKSKGSGSTRSQRAKIFFGCPGRNMHEAATKVDQLDLCQELGNNPILQESKGFNDKNNLGIYIKHCFVSRIKERMLPPKKRRNGISRNLSGATFDKFQGTGQRGYIREEPIEFLTPLKNSSLRKSSANIALRDDQNDSLVYTVSRRRSSLRPIFTDDCEGTINNFE